MSIVRWTPFLEPFGEWDKMVDEFHKGVLSGFSPAVDIYEKGNNIMVEMQISSIDAENVEVSVENDVLTIHGKTEKKTEVDEKDYYRREIHTGSFYRTIPLPAPVNGDKATAVYEDGVLRVAVPKKEKDAVKKVTIKVKKLKSSSKKK